MLNFVVLFDVPDRSGLGGGRSSVKGLEEGMVWRQGLSWYWLQ